MKVLEYEKKLRIGQEDYLNWHPKMVATEIIKRLVAANAPIQVTRTSVIDITPLRDDEVVYLGNIERHIDFNDKSVVFTWSEECD